MPHWPHWYVLREDGSAREFDFVNRLIKKFGYRQPPHRDIIAAEIVEDLQAALARFAEIANDLKKPAS